MTCSAIRTGALEGRHSVLCHTAVNVSCDGFQRFMKRIITNHAPHRLAWLQESCVRVLTLEGVPTLRRLLAVLVAVYRR